VNVHVEPKHIALVFYRHNEAVGREYGIASSSPVDQQANLDAVAVVDP